MRAKKKFNGVELDYVSGSFTGFIKIGNKDKELEKENIDDTLKLMEYTQNKLKGYFTFSSLFNAYQEEKDGKLINENDKLGHSALYSDSGGLQVVTAGKVITDEIKEKVYTVQAKYSDFAMTFDEMPLKVSSKLGSGSVAGDDGQVYIDELIPVTAKNSAVHIQKQIDMFNDLKSDTKIMPILHGYSADTFLEYGKTILENLDHIEDKIQGVAIASLRGHADNKVGIMKIFDYVPKILNSDKIDNKYLQHVHLLGVASPQRIMPAIMMVKKGILPIKRLSFDSTAITKAYTFGRVYQTVEEYKNPGDFSTELTLKPYTDKEYPNVAQFYRSVHEHFKDYENYVFTDWEDLANHSQNNGDELTPSKQYEKYGKEYQRKMLAQVRYCSMYHAFTYLGMIEAYLDDELTLEEIMGYNDSIFHIFQTFDTKDTHEEYAEACEYFYHTATRGRTDLRIVRCKTLKEYEERFEKDDPCLHAALGIDKDIEIISEELKKPWIKASMKRAAKGNDFAGDENPTNNLF